MSFSFFCMMFVNQLLRLLSKKFLRSFTPSCSVIKNSKRRLGILIRKKKLVRICLALHRIHMKSLIRLYFNDDVSSVVVKLVVTMFVSITSSTKFTDGITNNNSRLHYAERDSLFNSYVPHLHGKQANITSHNR